MKISADTEKALEFLDYISGNNLRKRNDLGVILEIGASFGEDELVNDIIFYGSASWNISLTMKKEAGTANETRLRNQYRELLAELEGYLIELLKFGEEADVKRFNDIYLANTAGSEKNLLDLSHDLAQLKSLQKQLKDKSKG
jgi:hypothetical protein